MDTDLNIMIKDGSYNISQKCKKRPHNCYPIADSFYKNR